MIRRYGVNVMFWRQGKYNIQVWINLTEMALSNNLRDTSRRPLTNRQHWHQDTSIGNNSTMSDATWIPLHLRVQVDGHDETVQTEYFSENEDQDHSHEETGLLRRSTHSCVSHNADSEAGRQSWESYSQAGSQSQETPAIHNTALHKQSTNHHLHYSTYYLWFTCFIENFKQYHGENNGNFSVLMYSLINVLVAVIRKS